MDETWLRLAIAGGLGGAVLLGWILHWIFAGIGRVTGPKSIKKTADLATRLHDAEEARDVAIAALETARMANAERITELEAELAQAHGQMREMRAAWEQVLDESGSDRG